MLIFLHVLHLFQATADVTDGLVVIECLQISQWLIKQSKCGYLQPVDDNITKLQMLVFSPPAGHHPLSIVAGPRCVEYA